MSAVDEFLFSVRDVFGRNRSTDWAQVGLLFGCAIVATSSLSFWRTRHRAKQALASAISEVVASAGLSATDVAYLKRIADAAGLPVLEVMTRLPAFERATAGALASPSPPPLRPSEGSAFERVRLLRKALAFSPLPAHHWLGSTRELVNGDQVTVGGATTPVVLVNEASFAVDLPLKATPAPAGEVSVTIVRLEDSRYLTRVRVLAVEAAPAMEAELGVYGEPGPGSLTSGGRAAGRRVFFAHDEQPERQQNREHVRIRVEGPVSLRLEPGAEPEAAGLRRVAADPAEPPADAPREPVILVGMLVDVSAGGLSADLRLEARDPRRTAGWAGTSLRCSFSFGEAAHFENLAAKVVALETRSGAGVQRMRVSFWLSEGERDRLAAAVARHRRGSAEGAGG